MNASRAALEKLRREIEPMAKQIICPTDNTFTRQLKVIDEALALDQPCSHTFEESVKFVAAHLDRMGKTYIEIAVDPNTKEIGWSFVATLAPGGAN